jgi:hypothetical protein
MGLQVADHQAFQRREWTAQRIGWVGIAAFVAAAFLGVLGPGPLSSTTATSDDQLVEVEHQRFRHLEADDMLTVVLAPAAVTGDTVEVELAQDWVQSVDISGIAPEPQEQVATSYGVRLVVSSEAGSEVTIQIAFRATRIGIVDAGVRFQGQTTTFRQLTYP